MSAVSPFIPLLQHSITSIFAYIIPALHYSSFLVILWQFSQLFITENRAILANIEMTDVTATAFSDPAFHPFFERGVDPLVRELQRHQLRERELDHDRGTTDDGVRVL
jgi:hypothetical protein